MRFGDEIKVGPARQGAAAVADPVCQIIPGLVGADIMLKIDGMLDKLKAENVSFHVQLVFEKAAHARALRENIRMQQHKKKVVEEKRESARRLAKEKAKHETSAVIEQLKNEVSGVTMKAAGEIGSITTSLENAKSEAADYKKERDDAKLVLKGLRGDVERVTYERDGLHGRLQLARRNREKYVAAVEEVQRAVGKLQEYVANDAAALQKQMKDHWIRMCHKLVRVVAERVLKSREVQAQDAGAVAKSYTECWSGCLKRLK